MIREDTNEKKTNKQTKEYFLIDITGSKCYHFDTKLFSGFGRMKINSQAHNLVNKNKYSP